jgi:hypothetical protein
MGPVNLVDEVEERGLAPKLLALFANVVFLMVTARLKGTVALGLSDVRR